MVAIFRHRRRGILRFPRVVLLRPLFAGHSALAADSSEVGVLKGARELEPVTQEAVDADMPKPDKGQLCEERGATDQPAGSQHARQQPGVTQVVDGGAGARSA